MTTSWIAGQLTRMASARSSAPDIPRFNPRPMGVIRAGSASDAVLQALHKRRGAYFNHAQIVQLCDRTTKAVCWALIFLQELGFIEATADDSRNARYRRYRITPKGIDHVASGTRI
jgi:hypothetical protein